eukprot:TRINITY_DN81931_c0_g1_i1.p1 TRINITY_DN81931_c0_g1~~TRINITY_DN81931_c0_g1_i1.p1  ORF type:complete len:375 (+),score=121.01 TRINITY_DN81931_c0_g1_i1:30-1154(+)
MDWFPEGPLKVLAPMVNQSELAFRILVRRYGTNVCYTPMMHARLFKNDPKYRAQNFSTNAEDRPLVAHFCCPKDEPAETLLKAAQFVEDKVDAVDLNLGCPQGIARKGKYGSFMLEEFEVIESFIKILHENLSIPVTAKIRLLPSFEKTLELVKLLERSGCSLITIHGRTKEQKKDWTGKCDWEKINTLRQAVSIPVVANGGIENYDDVDRCLEKSGCVGVMTAEAILENPAIFSDNLNAKGERVSLEHLALEYLEIARECETPIRFIRPHLFRILHSSFERCTELRADLGKCSNIDECKVVVHRVMDAVGHENLQGLKSRPEMQWYRRHRIHAERAKVKAAAAAAAAEIEAAKKNSSDEPVAEPVSKKPKTEE